jgi:tetratricopeptide (TPR) repeat protein
VQLARAFIDLADFTRAHSELERSEKAAEGSSNVRLHASIRECVGICALSEGKDERALRVFREARAMFEGFGGLRGMAIQDYFIGRALTSLGRYDEAVGALEEALECMRKIDDRLFVGRILLRLAQAIRREGRLDEAEAVLADGLGVLAPLGMRLEEAESHEELAAIAEARRDAAAAADHRERAQAIYRSIGHPRALDTGDRGGSAGATVGA